METFPLPVTFAATNLTYLLALTMAFVTAFIGGAIAMRLKQSPILGYLFAGLLIGPFTPGFIADATTTQFVADIGVILLLFGVGVHFSLAELVRLKVIAGVGGVAQIALTIAISMLLGTALGWSPLATFFLGSAVAISSSAVLAKLLDERGDAGSEHGNIALGWMIVQDLVTVVLVVLLTGLSGNSGNLGASLAAAIGKAALFVALLIIVGAKVLPWWLDRVAAFNSRELFLIAITGLSIGTALLAEEVGISLALGAFLAGLVLSESDLSHHILGEIDPIRELFSVVFFVSIGMLVQPAVVWRELPTFAFILALIVIAKPLVTGGMILLLRYPARVALLVGAGVGQAGEFSFLLARIGREANVLSADRFTLILSACAASIIIAPLLFLIAERFAGRFEHRWLNRPRYTGDVLASPLYRDHIIVCGYGRAGSIVTRLLRGYSLPVVVIEQDRGIVKQLHRERCPVVFGNAANRYVLDAAGARRARGVVVALPDALDARRVLDGLRRRRPDMDVVVRAHSDGDQAVLIRRGATAVVVAEEELALAMGRHILRRHGADERMIDAIIDTERDRRLTAAVEVGAAEG